MVTKIKLILIFKMKKKHFTIPVFIPMQACPFRCIFCDQEKISGHVDIPNPEDVVQIIEKNLTTIPTVNTDVEVGFFGGTFTGISAGLQQAYLEAVQPFILKKQIEGIRLSTRPDFIDGANLAMLNKFNVHTIELGAQSMNGEVLKRSGRGHSVQDIITASEKIRENGFRLGLQMMVGLPGDSAEKSVATAIKFVEMKARDVRIYPALVIRGTPLEKLFKQGKYKPMELGEAVDVVSRVYRIFEKAGVNIIRIGLHPSDGLINGEELIAGPFHVSFRELVLTKLWEEELQNLLQNEGKDKITVFIPPGQINYAVGYQSKNKNRLLEKFKNVRFKTDQTLTGRQYYVDYN
jgi:histone acetyltransferase (RNA polymerase elongator complex component)